MLKFMHKRRGAISIFLIVVLLPMMMVSAIFVDESRIQLGSSIATAAGDLTMNTALTNYDTVLKEMYGLFATSQDMDELYANLETYYRKSIVSAGIAEADADDYAAQIMEYLKSETGKDDLMNMNLKEFTVTQADNGNLANAAMLKNQIVDFMKYRAPLGIGMDFLNALQSMKNLNKQTKLVEDKTAFYEQETKVISDLQSAWTQMQIYQYKGADWGESSELEHSFPKDSDNYFSKMNGDLESRKSALETAVEESITYLHFDGSMLGLDATSVSFDQGDEDDKWDDKWTFEWFGETKTFKTTTSVIVTTKKNVLDSISSVKKAKDELKNAKDGDFYKKLAKINNGTKSDQELMDIITLYNKEGKSSGYAKAVKDYVQALVDLKENYYRFGEDEAGEVNVKSNGDGTFKIPASDETADATLASAVNSYIKDMIDSDGNIKDEDIREYNHLMGSLYSKGSGIKGTYNEKKLDVKDKVEGARDAVNNYCNFINARIDNLSSAIDSLNTVKTSVSAGGAYDKSLTDWKNSANALGNDSMAQNDNSEIAKVKEQFKPEEFQTLINKLTSAKSSLEAEISELEKCEILGTKWKDIGDSNTAEFIINNISDSQKNSISSSDTNETYDYSSVINEVKATVKKGSPKTSFTSSEENPDLTKPQVRLYTYLYNNYKDNELDYGSGESKAENKKSEKEQELKNQKNTLKSKADEYKNKNTATSTKTSARSVSKLKSSLPSGASSSDEPQGKAETDSDKMKEGSGNNIKEMLEKITGYISSGEIATDFRDNLYITDYVMGMFTYDTYEAELSKKYGNGSSAFESWYSASGDSYTLKDAYKTEAAQAVSLTKNEITPNNHYLYGAETEYIIYGGEEPYKSADKAYGAIFLIRFGFNTVYAFQDTSIRGVATSVATSLFGTPPLTPLIPVAKLAITLGFSIAESAYDLYQLKCGEAVPIIKKSDTFAMSPANITKEVGSKLVDAAGNEVDKITNSAVDKLTELMNKTDEELQAWINSKSEEMDSLVDGVSKTLVEKYANYSNEVVEQLVTIINNVNLSFSAEDGDNGELSPSKETEIKRQLKEWADGKAGTDDVIKSVYDIAYNYIVDNGYVEQMFNSIKETAESEVKDTAKAMESAVNKTIEEISDAISSQIEKAMTTAGTKLSDFKVSCTQKLKTAASQGAEKFKEELTNQIGKTFGDSDMGKQAGTDAVANFTSWRYSDYLTLFLMISLFKNEQEVINRIADVIQMNMEKKEGTISDTGLSDGAFLMKNASTHINIEATVEVKPLMMVLPFMAETTTSQLSGTKWYTVKYKGTAGY